MAKSFRMKFYEECLEDAMNHPYGSYTVIYDDGSSDPALLTVNPGTHHFGNCLGFGGHTFQFRTPNGEIIRSNNCWLRGRRSSIPKKLINKFEVWKKDTTRILIPERRTISFNAAALAVLQDYPEDIKTHINWGWRIGISHCGHIRYDEGTDSTGYPLAQALKYITSKYMYRFEDEVWIEPAAFFAEQEEDDMCKWIIRNNLNKHDYTTMENTSAGRANMRNHSGIWDCTYDREYKEWIEEQLA